MSDFLTGCLRLFSMTYHAAVSTVAFFEFMAGVLALGCCYGVFLTIRRLTITANRLVSEDEARKAPEAPTQLNLFDSVEAQEQQIQEDESKQERERRLQEAMLGIKKKFGKNAILNGGSYLEGATARERNGQIGGHKA